MNHKHFVGAFVLCNQVRAKQNCNCETMVIFKGVVFMMAVKLIKIVS